MDLFVLILSFFVMLFLGIPIAFALCLSSLLYMVLYSSVPLIIIGQQMLKGVDSFTLLAIPFFIIAGSLMTNGGISKRIVNFAKQLVGWMPGGLAVVDIVASMIFAAMTGAGAATTAAVGGMMIPHMEEEGYDPGFASAIQAMGGVFGPIIPPSTLMVLYAVASGESVGGMFLGGILPGLYLGLVLIIVVVMLCKKKGYGGGAKFNGKAFVKATVDAFWALLAPIIILGGIYSGMLTATESAAVAVVWAAIAGLFIYKELTFKELIPILKDSAKSSAMILFIIASSTAFSWVFTFSGASQALVNAVISMHLNSALFCFVVAIILLIFGTFMEGTAIAVLLVPVLWPIAQSMGIDVIHFGMIVCISNVVGTMTPPVAVNIFSASTVSGLKMGDIAKAEIPFLIGYVAVFFCCVFSETFCTFLI